MSKKKRKRPLRKGKIDNIAPLSLPEGFRLVGSDDTFRYQCSMCGDCCRNVQDAVMLESLDLYRLARFFRESGKEILGIDDIILPYTNTMFLGGIDYYPIFLLKTSGPENSCVFLKDNRCSVQPAKPRTCRLYPLSAGPKDLRSGGFEFVIVSHKQHHYTGPEVRVGDWMDANFSEEDREFVLLDIKSANELAPILRRLKQIGADEQQVLKLFILYKYAFYELDEPFLPQFKRNMAALKRILADLAGAQ